MPISLTDEEANALRLILLDHRDCVSESEVSFQERMNSYRGQDIVELLESHGVKPEYSAEEYDLRVNLLVHLDELIAKLGGSDD